MYSEEDFKSFDPFTPAEIHLVPLESLILQMASLGLSDISNFPFLEQPSKQSLSDSIEKLKFVGAVEMNDDGLVLTPLGDSLSQLPVDIHVGKMLIFYTRFLDILWFYHTLNIKIFSLFTIYDQYIFQHSIQTNKTPFERGTRF